MNKLVITLVTFFFSFFTFSGAYAADTPTSLKGVKVVNATEAKALQDKGGKIIDVRMVSDFAEGHVVNSVNVAYKEKSAKTESYDAKEDSFNLAEKIADKNAVIITYCNGPSCWKSYKAANEAVKMGYKSVYWFRDGLPGWKTAGLPVE